MTVVGAVLDSSLQTRSGFLRALENRVGECGVQPLKREELGDCTCCWNACRTAPVSVVQRGGTTAWVLGHIDGIEAPGQGYAETLLSHFEHKGTDEIGCYSGYFLAILCRQGETWVFTDRLGLFPCYYATKDGAIVLGTSSDIPTLHPAMPRRANWKGVLGYLLCMYEVLGESVWEGCFRLGVGEILHVAQGRSRIVRRQTIPISDDCFGLPYETQLEQADEAMAKACEPCRGRSFTLLMSGGLDSRLLAGYLSKAGIVPRIVHTLGDRKDIEFRCARRVCETLGWRQTLLPIELQKFSEFTDRQIADEQLSYTMSDFSWWSLVDHMRSAAEPLVSGMVGDPVLGGSHMLLGYDPATRSHSFDTLFRSVNSYGLSRDVLRKVFASVDVSRLVDEIVEQLRSLYESLPGYGFQKVWQFDLMHRQRYHTAGVLRRFSHSVWPMSPLASSVVLTVSGGMPASTICRRRLQQDLLITRFPKLARLPLDRNAWYTKPLLPSVACRIGYKVLQKTGILNRRLHHAERRYYYRVFDINNEGWRLVRARCDSALESMAGILNLEEYRKILPPWDRNVRVEGDAIAGESGPKSLLGFVLWHQRCASGDRGENA